MEELITLNQLKEYDEEKTNKIDNRFNNVYDTFNELHNNFAVSNFVATDAHADNLDVNTVSISGAVGTNGQVLGVVNGRSEWMDIPDPIDADNFSVNNLYVSDVAKVGNYDVTSMVVMAEDDYNNLGSSYRNQAFYVTTPNGNMYIHGIQYAPSSIKYDYAAYANLPNFARNNTILGVSYLTFTTGEVTNSFVNGGGYYGIGAKSPIDNGVGRWENSAPVGTKANGVNVVTNAKWFYITNASNMYNNCRILTDTFICNPALITNAPDGYDVMEYCINMSGTFNGCRSFNQPITIGSNVTNMSNTFGNCTNFNQPITIGNNVTDMGNTFFNCTNFNQPITIGNNVTNMYYTFINCRNFNQPVTIPDGVTNMYGTFFNCTNFNQPIAIGNNVNNMSFTFNGCTSFNQPVTIPDGVTSMSATFNGCRNLNSPVTIGNGVTNMVSTFYGCYNFNQPVTIPDGVTDMRDTFYYCSSFNQPIDIPNSVTNMFGTFNFCSSFNQPITIPDGVNRMSYTFYYCSSFNQPVTIPDGVTDMSDTFYECTNLNSPVTIPDGVTDMFFTFSNCRNFNQPVTIPDGVTNMVCTFNECRNFNQPVTIPDGVTDMVSTFRNCTTLAASTVPIHISSSIALGDTSNYIYNALVNGETGISFDPSRILNDA